VSMILFYIIRRKDFFLRNTTCLEIIRRSSKYIKIKCYIKKIMNEIIDFIRILSFRACFTYNCFISITFCFIFCTYCFDHEDDYLIKREWVHMHSLNFVLSYSIVSVICLSFLCSTHVRKIVSIIHLQTKLVPHRFIFFCPQYRRSFVLPSLSPIVDDQKKDINDICKLYDAISLILLLFKLKIRIFSTNTSNNVNNII